MFPPKRRFVPHRTGDGNPLGQLESTVMEAVWRHGNEVTVGEVLEALPEEKPVAYNTVKTTMERLADKGILTRVKRGKAYVYSAAVTQVELERRIVNNALDRLIEQFPTAVASFFVNPWTEISPEKLALLTEAVERAKEDVDA